MEYTMGYFRVLGEDAYPILGYDYVTTPARYTRSAGELALITLCMEKKAADIRYLYGIWRNTYGSLRSCP